MRTLVVDIDDTLLIGSRMSRFFWWVSLQMQRLGRRLQRVNPNVATELSKYERVIVLTGRDVKESSFTENQLRHAGVTFDQLICCPRKRLISDWKWSEVGSLSRKEPVVWIDDLLETDTTKDSAKQNPNLTTIPPRSVAAKTGLSSELEWL